MSTKLIDRPQPAKKAARKSMSSTKRVKTQPDAISKAGSTPKTKTDLEKTPDNSATVTTSSSSDSCSILTEQDSVSGDDLQINTNSNANTDSVTLSPVTDVTDDAASTTETSSSSSDAVLDLSKYESPSPKAQTAVPLLEKLKIKLRPETLARLAELRAMAAEAQPEQPARGNWVPLYPVYARLRSNGYSRDEALDWLVQQGAVAAEHRTKALNALKTLAVRRNKL